MSHNTRYELQRGTRETRIDQVGTLPAINHWGEEFQIHLDNGGVINGLDPSGSGQKISFVVHALEVGSISIKFASPITISGNNNTVTMSAVHNFVEFVSRKTAAGYRWVPTSESGTTYSTT